jgi:hypothetical protein
MKPNVTKFFKTVGNAASKHSPEILTAVGIAGMIATTVLAVKATPKALEKIDEAEYEKVDKNPEGDSKLTPMETVKATYKLYIPAAATGVFSIACFIGANSIHAKRHAALAAVYQISTTALNEYKESVKETVDEETKKAIDEKAAEKRIKNDPPKQNINHEIPVAGSFLCYDAGGNHYFRSDENHIREAINKLNARMNDNIPYVSLNELYSELGVRGTEVGELLGWNRYREGLIQPFFSTQMADNGEPCIVVSYGAAPAYDYYKVGY